MYSIFSLTLKQVAKMINDGNDNLDNYIAVTHSGMVSLEVLDQYKERHVEYRFYFDAFYAGNDYVGEEASKDAEHIESIYKGILYAWKTGITGCYDMWRADTKNMSICEVESMAWPK